MTNLALVDTSTGEVISSDVVSYRTSKQQEAYQGVRAHQLKEKHSFRTTGDKFTNGNMDTIRQLRREIDDTTLGYVLYLQTALQYDGTLGTSKRAFTKVKDFEAVLNVKALQVKKVVKALRIAGVLNVNDEGVYCMNPTYHWKGKMHSSDAQKNVKLMDAGIKALRDAGMKAKDLGVLYALLPYINYSKNLVTHNPYEYDVNKVQPMNLQDVADVLNYEHAQRVSGKLRKITFTAPDGRAMYAFGIVSIGKESNVIVNPLLVRRLAEGKGQELLSNDFLTLFQINRPKSI
ncbi:hypothetical protein EKG37_18115 [Robertmurraya yapensis]|uniref:Plasmid replication protein RepL domain-containing protein n=1 Tax=Bacillus yapensis TaxID=2492960 RepID=A0A3S0KJ07_9BACI|nr:hypothetical protein [Bacillus yapensis]RTR27810.1 hypothetical protein EKG37_18115 [Bacillus yapensis]TKS94213.1 hypothetical protein FAR12_18125 [Bacillus yapensis]